MIAENDELRERVNTVQAGTSGGSSPVDTKLLSKPSEFDGKEEDWTRFSLMKAYLGAIDPRYNELLKIVSTVAILSPGTTDAFSRCC